MMACRTSIRSSKASPKAGNDKVKAVQKGAYGAGLLSNPRVLEGAREPSGAVALPELGGLLVVDDEPYDGPSKGIFFVKYTRGGLVNLPVKLPKGLSIRWDDWEGATRMGGKIFMLASHAYNSSYRAKICHFPIKNLKVLPRSVKLSGPITCFGGLKHRRRILEVLEGASRRLGFPLPKRLIYRAPKRGGLDIEGFAYHLQHKLFYLGLRSPLASLGGREYAIMLSMGLTEAGPLLAFAGLLDLDGRGIRELAYLPGGALIISAGPAGEAGRFDLYKLEKLPAAPFRLSGLKLMTPDGFPTSGPRIKPEGLAVYQNRLVVFSDSGAWDDRPAHYYILPMFGK